VHFFVTSSREARLTRLTLNADGTVTEGPVPAELPSNEVTLLQLYGNMTFAGAETVEARLPSVQPAERPVVILRLRAQEGIGSSFVAMLERYSQQLRARGGKLMVAGVNPRTKRQLDRTETTGEILGEENVFVSTTTLGASTHAAYTAAQHWLDDEA
jgi:SulP family sulfate permease